MSAQKTFKADELNVRIFDSGAELARDAAREAQQHLLNVLTAAPTAAVILATGNSQLQFLDAWIALGGLDWKRITFFHMDEYLGISDTHPASFRRYLRERVAQKIKPGAFHYIDGDALEPIAECERYARLLGAQPIALCCLGIGENGHLAFNDPPVANFDDPLAMKIVKLDEGCRHQQVGEGHFSNLEAVPKFALTLTIPALCNVRKMLCIVPEKRKAVAVRGSLSGPIGTACPGSFLRRQPHAILFLDSDSASLL